MYNLSIKLTRLLPVEKDYIFALLWDDIINKSYTTKNYNKTS